MRGRRFGALSFAVVLVTAVLVQAGGPAGATTNSCAMSEFPAKLESYSGLKVACTSDGTGTASSGLTIHDFNDSVWHVGSARTITAATTLNSATITSTTGFLSNVAGPAGDINRSITGTGIPSGTWIVSVSGNSAVLSAKATATAASAPLAIEDNTARTFKDGHITNLSTTVTSATAGFTAADANQIISGNGLKPGTKIATVTNGTTITIAPAADLTSTTAQLSIGDTAITAVRAINDGHTTLGSPNVTSATAGFAAADTGTGITGPGIPAGTYIKTVSSATAIIVTKNATATATTAKLVIGTPTISAPKNGDHVSQLASELDLSPTFLAAVDSCAEGTPEGFVISGDWYNPGSFVGATTYPANTVAEILYKTSTISFPAYVSVVATPSVHFDVTLPSLPIGTAACANSPSATTFTFNAIASSQETAPGLPIVRAIPDIVGAGPVTATGKVVSGTTTYTTTCSIGRQINNPGFTCGNATIGLAG
jgi:hypothetical protein